jgi:uncharacterized membrane protein YgdD (TMEM256/DUF423 family)
MSAATWFRIGAVLGFLGVAAGSFGAHGLEKWLEPSSPGMTAEHTNLVTPEHRMEVFRTGVQYHLYHAFGLLALGLLLARVPGSGGMAASVAGWAFLFGVALFSGSLYAMALTGMKWLGMITPIGGVGFLVGWASLAMAAWPRVAVE